MRFILSSKGPHWSTSSVRPARNTIRRRWKRRRSHQQLRLGVRPGLSHPRGAGGRGQTQVGEVLPRPQSSIARRWRKSESISSPAPRSSPAPNPAVIRAKSVLACALARQLRTLETELEKYRRLITELFNQHPDHDCFGSLPGAGEKIAPDCCRTGQ